MEELEEEEITASKLNQTPQTKDWRKLLVFREEWKKYSDKFYKQCKIDEEIERHSELLKEIEQSPTDINAVLAKDFNEEFSRHLSLLCLSAVCVYDNTVENAETLDAALAKFDDIFNSPSLDAATMKNEVDPNTMYKNLVSFHLIPFIPKTENAKKNVITMNVKGIMYHLYKATKSSLRSIAPKEMKLLKHLLNITDPEERCTSGLTLYVYHLNREESEIREARQLTLPMVMQRLFILKETIEEKYLLENTAAEDSKPKEL
ncbi:hypothetical protein MKW92_043853 [Papaver armeniacum]|nr:hypothetical protein MKW92_043853 [Papaver armeniacum]